VNAPVVDESQANTAIFYSITNTQAGLKGVSFGDFLIKRVVNHLIRDLPGIKTFSTLSPVPGFMQHLHTLANEDILTDAQQKSLDTLAPNRAITDIVSGGEWIEDAALCDALEMPLMKLCAHYLTTAKYRGRALDSVANFHLNNGARLERINWLADRSPKGIRESAGMMVNYLYRLKDIETNHESYREAGTISISPAVQSLLK
jgi:malonyl-CoA decarboxylase